MFYGSASDRGATTLQRDIVLQQLPQYEFILRRTAVTRRPQALAHSLTTMDTIKMLMLPSDDLPSWCQTLYPIIKKAVPSCPIAGSFALWFWMAQKKTPTWTPNNVDFWFSSCEEMKRVAAEVSSLAPEAPVEKCGVAIIKIHLSEVPTLRFIWRGIYHSGLPSPAAFLSMFDLSVAQVAITRFVLGDLQFVFGDDDVRADIANGSSRCFRPMGTNRQAAVRDRLVAATDRAASRRATYRSRGFEITQGEERVFADWGLYV